MWKPGTSSSKFDSLHSSNEDADEVSELPDNVKYSEFITSFNQILRHNDAVGLSSLCLYHGDGFEGQAHIHLHPEDICSI